MLDTTTIPSGVLSTLSFMSEILGDYTTYSARASASSTGGMITWSGAEGDCWFASLCWDEDACYVEIADGIETGEDTGHNAMYTIFGYCRYHGIYHRLLGANLPIFKEWTDVAA